MPKDIKKTGGLSAGQIIGASSLPRPETELLLAFLLNKSREFLLTHPETLISRKVSKKFQDLADKRLKNWPLAYLTGHKEFYGWDFKVSAATLVPRPETELIVEKIIDFVASDASGEMVNNHRPANHLFKPLIIDLGTGSGAIIITIAKELKRLMPLIYRQTDFLAGDISKSALKVAAYNAKINKLNNKIKFYRSDLLASLKITKKNAGQKKEISRDLIIAANLPYLTPKQIQEAPSISREPKTALNGGFDGLKYYRRLFRQLKDISYRTLAVFCEIDPEQTKKMAVLAAKYFPDAQSIIYQDYSRKDRLFVITKIRP